MNFNDLLKRLKDFYKKFTPVEKSIEAEIEEEIEISQPFGTEEAHATLAKQYGLPIFTDISNLRLTPAYYKKVPYPFVKKHHLLPIAEEEGVVLIAISNPLNLEPLQELRFLLSKPVKAVYASKEQIQSAINECYNKESGAASEMIAGLALEGQEEGEGEVEIYDLLDDSKVSAPIIRLLNLILKEAIQQGASDIHFEPMEEGLRVRYRIDGVLHTRHTPSPEYVQQLLTRIKVMSKLDIAERRLPQDGRIKLRMGAKEIDFRISTVPISSGERIVLRILDKGNITLGLSQMGMPDKMLKEFKQLIELPEGIILVTGPTGSGKTTTLYSAVSDLYNEEINIMTVEDPVEYHLKGIAQIGVKSKIGLSFAAGLRHILRQDPDVVMIGEIRDTETAEIAIQASLTGHLVLSTLHTNDAPSAITRLVDMGIEPYLLSSCIVGVLTQRLVRTICPHCKEAYCPQDEELQRLGISRKELKANTVYRGRGCEICFGYGYKGRHGIYELMVIGSAIQQQIVTSADAIAMRRVALSHGLFTLREHGANLVIEGLTTIKEVLRVIKSAVEV